MNTHGLPDDDRLTVRCWQRQLAGPQWLSKSNMLAGCEKKATFTTEIANVTFICRRDAPTSAAASERCCHNQQEHQHKRQGFVHNMYVLVTYVLWSAKFDVCTSHQAKSVQSDVQTSEHHPCLYLAAPCPCSGPGFGPAEDLEHAVGIDRMLSATRQTCMNVC